MSDAPAIPVTVVTGFLGAGKTTLLDAWLAESPRDEIAVIVNELGAIGIDGERLAARARALIEIAGGCVCCATQVELVRALSELAARSPALRRIFVETSGAASPAGVVRAIARTGRLRLDGVITVVDASRAVRLAGHDLALEQIAYADVLVLSRADACDERVLGEARALLAARNAVAAVAFAERGVLRDPVGSLDSLLASRDHDVVRPIAIAPSTGGHGIESISLTLSRELDEERFLEWVESELARFEGRLLRVKGVLAIRGVDARVVLQGVAGEAEVELGAPWDDAPRQSRLVLIGFGLDRTALESGFERCAV